jgi:hypothetical protein
MSARDNISATSLSFLDYEWQFYRGLADVIMSFLAGYLKNEKNKEKNKIKEWLPRAGTWKRAIRTQLGVRPAVELDSMTPRLPGSSLAPIKS